MKTTIDFMTRPGPFPNVKKFECKECGFTGDPQKPGVAVARFSDVCGRHRCRRNAGVCDCLACKPVADLDHEYVKHFPRITGMSKYRRSKFNLLALVCGVRVGQVIAKLVENKIGLTALALFICLPYGCRGQF